MFQSSICKRCKQEIAQGGQVQVPGVGLFCYNCATVLAGDDDYIDPDTGEKRI